VKCARGESSFAPPAIVKAEIERVWAGGGGLSMVLSEVSYKSFAGTNMHNPQFATQYGETAMANPLGMSVALISADGFLAMGRRNERVAYYPGRIHPFAGALEPEDGLDVFGAVGRELNEELGLSAAEIGGMKCLGMAEDRGLAHPELICYAEAQRTLDDLRRRVDETEHYAVVPIEVKREVFERELGSAKLYTPIALATILLCGRERFGEEWFDATFAA